MVYFLLVSYDKFVFIIIVKFQYKSKIITNINKIFNNEHENTNKK